MKKKNFLRIALLLGLFNFIFISSFTINAVSIEYTLDINKDDTFIWKVKKLEEDIYNSIFIPEVADFEEDDYIKHQIREIDKTTDYWKVEYYYWDYTDDIEDLEDDADEKESDKVYRDPEDQADDILLIEEIIEMWVIPTPFTNYLDEFEEFFEHQVISIYVDGDSITAKISATEEIPATYEVELTYDVNGVMEKLEYYDQTGSNFLELVLKKEAIVPGYDIFIIFGTLLFCGLIGIIFIRKKLQISKK